MNKSHGPLLIGAAAWFGMVYGLAAHGGFINGPDERPLAVGTAFAAPIILFLLAIRVSPGWRARVTSLSPVLLITVNGWRFIGLGFLMAASEGLLPAGFAWPAGYGDIFMAATAPWVAAKVATDDRFRFGSVFLIWNLMGIADFLDAVLWGTLYSWPGFTSSITAALMQRLPFALIPCFFVPLVAMAHITLLEQRRGSTDSVMLKSTR
jgi:hypothetical protein